MNNGRERGTSRPGVSNGQYNPAVLQNDQSGEVRLFFVGMQPDMKSAVSLENIRTVVGKVSVKATSAGAASAAGGAQIWNTQTSNFGASVICSVAYGNGVWVAAGSGGALRTSTERVYNIAASTTIDGYTWWIKT